MVAILWQMMGQLIDQVLPSLNALRESVGARRFERGMDYIRASSGLLYYTAEPFEYPRNPWPEHVRLVGPGIWEPISADKLPERNGARPHILVTTSTEFQNDGRLIETAIEALGNAPYDITITTGAVDPDSFAAPAGIRIVRYAPHGAILREAACVVCHGGMGITQKALGLGVPVCAVPFGRDQFEVGQHIVAARAGVSLPAFKLTAEALLSAPSSGPSPQSPAHPGSRTPSDAAVAPMPLPMKSNT